MTSKRAAKIMYDLADFYAEDNAHMHEIRETVDKDVRDLKAIAKELSAGRVDVARRQVFVLDTLVRDYVPKNVYDWLTCRHVE